VPHADIPAILWSADFGISLLEPNVYFAASPPVKVLEFLAAGLPVIANKMPTHSLYLEDGMNALLVPYDADSFANAMRTIIEDPKLRERLSGGALMSGLRFSNESAHRALVESALELIQ
jgi:glycosyltransferase involved in cell wall biosynthesis